MGDFAMAIFDEIINNRHSTRIFLDKPISKEDEKYIEEALNNAPTAGNMTLFNVIKIKDPNRLNILADLCDHQPFIKTAKMAMIFVTNSSRWYDTFNKVNNTNFKPNLADYYLGMCDGLIAAQTAVLAAENKGIGSCYIGDIIENYEKIKEFLKLPQYVNVITMVVFGYKDPTKTSKRPPKFKTSDFINEEYYRCDAMNDFINKFDGDKEQAIALINRVFNFKMKSDFFKEMNRSMERVINEYKNN